MTCVSVSSAVNPNPNRVVAHAVRAFFANVGSMHQTGTIKTRYKRFYGAGRGMSTSRLTIGKRLTEDNRVFTASHPTRAPSWKTFAAQFITYQARISV